MRQRLILIVAGLLLWAAGTGWNAASFDRRSAVLRMYEPELVALPRPNVAKQLASGFDAVIADLYWIGAVHYLGESRYERYHYAQLIDYIDIITTLAPDLHEAYWFGGIAAPYNTGTEWVNVDGAVRTLEKGLERFPDDWKMRMALAYDYAAYQKRFKDSGDQLRIAAATPGAPRYLASLSTRMYVSAGDIEGATAIAKQLFDSSDDPSVKEAMKQRVRELHEQRDLANLSAAVKQYQARTGKLPERLSQLVDAGLVPSIPNDPGGGEYLYDRATGEVRSAHLQKPLTAFGIR